MHFFLFLLSLFMFSCDSSSSSLKEYVMREDSAYKWMIEETRETETYDYYLLCLNSQQWLSEKELTEPLWQHSLQVIVPKSLKSDKAFMMIGGGSRHDKVVHDPESFLVQFALSTGTVAAQIQQVPNQPIHFKDEYLEKYEQSGRSEDALIAYTWYKHLHGEKNEYLARFPMTKAVVKGMDAVQELCEQESFHVPSQFFLSGFSKRAWTAWTTAGVDSRVFAFSPMVIDLLNIRQSFEHHFNAYGFWAPAVGNYVEMDIMRWRTSKEFERLANLVEPYTFREKFTMPKYIVNSAGDEFFLPDSWQFYLKDLPGDTYLRYIPNTDHTLRSSNALSVIQSFYRSLVEKKPLPVFTWNRELNGDLWVKSETNPIEVNLWTAINEEARDFRMSAYGALWKKEPVEISKINEYHFRAKKPSSGYTAFFIELVYDSGYETPLIFTTGVSVLPNLLPFNVDRVEQQDI
ncbi:MAG: PhoPQ-activated pathogenicity [Waddliaceae bacterium]|nr:PhoPQ-activated pathogenicity [Waddliaceae bacterium]